MSEKPDFPPPAAEDRALDYPAQASRQIPPAMPSVPPRPKERSGFGRGFGIGSGIGLGLGVMGVVGAVVMGMMMLFTSLSLVHTAQGTASKATTTIWGKGSSVIRAIEVKGTILADSGEGRVLSAGTYGYEVAQQLDELSGDDAGAVVLLVNTPGGSISGSRAIGDAVERYRKRTGKKVLVHVSSMSASGGVYATAPADQILADHGAAVGSIGVIYGPIMQYKNVVATGSTLLAQGIETRDGIVAEYFKAGTAKDFGTPWRSITPQERKHYTQMVQAEYAAFVDYIVKHRRISAAKIRGELGAYLFDNHRAKQVGLIDGVLGREDFYRHAAKAADLDPDDTRVEAVSQPQGWAGLLGAERAHGHAPAAAQGEGLTPVLSASICGRQQPLVYAGSMASVCGR